MEALQWEHSVNDLKVIQESEGEKYVADSLTYSRAAICDTRCMVFGVLVCTFFPTLSG
jgi:hypothetical protein